MRANRLFVQKYPNLRPITKLSRHSLSVLTKAAEFNHDIIDLLATQTTVHKLAYIKKFYEYCKQVTGTTTYVTCIYKSKH